MSTAESTLEASSNLESPMWTQEPGSHPDRMRMRARVAGMHCSLCTGTIEKALRQHPGVDAVAVSLTHEQALVEYDPAKVRPQVLLETLRQMGYSISDPRKLKPFEEDERDLVHGARRFLWATFFSLGSLTLVARPGDFWYALLEAFVAVSLIAAVFLVLRPRGWAQATAGTLLALVEVIGLTWLRQSGRMGATKLGSLPFLPW